MLVLFERAAREVANGVVGSSQPVAPLLSDQLIGVAKAHAEHRLNLSGIPGLLRVYPGFTCKLLTHLYLNTLFIFMSTGRREYSYSCMDTRRHDYSYSTIQAAKGLVELLIAHAKR